MDQYSTKRTQKNKANIHLFPIMDLVDNDKGYKAGWPAKKNCMGGGNDVKWGMH